MALPVELVEPVETTETPLPTVNVEELEEVLCEENPAEPEADVGGGLGEKVNVVAEVPLEKDWVIQSVFATNCMG